MKTKIETGNGVIEITSLKEAPVIFFEDTHTYKHKESGKELSGITGSIREKLFPVVYDGVSEEVLKKAAKRGTEIHREIQRCIETDGITSTDLTDKFTEAIDGICTPHLCEFLIWDGKDYASAIDIVATDENGAIELIDIKTTSTLHADYVSWQLSIYADWFEKQTGVKVNRISALHVKKDRSECRYVPIQRKSKECVDAFMECIYSGGEMPAKYRGIVTQQDESSLLPAEITSIADKIYEMFSRYKYAKEQLDECKKMLYDAFNKYGVKKWDCEKFSITKKESQITKSFDTYQFKKDYPEMYNQYLKDAPKSGSLLYKQKA